MSRPGGPPQGTRRLQVVTNSFKITGLPKKSYYQYDGELRWHVVTTHRYPITFSCGGSLIQYVSNTNLCTIVYHVHSCVLVVLPAFEDERVSRDARRRTEVFERLQNHTQNSLFSPKAIYDSDAIAYSSTVLSFGNAATVSRSECW